MASSIPPVKGAAFTFYTSVVSQADTDIFKTSVTLANGDWVYFGDGVAKGNLGTLPVEIGTTGVLAVVMASGEMNYDNVTILGHDAAGNEWQDVLISIYTAAQTLDTTDGVADTISTRVLLGVPAAAPGAANGALIAGTNAATTITSAAGAALTLSSTGGNGAGLAVSGNGSGAGVDIDGGATGIGIDVDAAANMGVSIAGNITGLVGALDIRNAHSDGNGMHVETASTSTARAGLFTHGGVGQFNQGHAIGQENNAGSGSYGQYNYGNTGIVAESTNSYAVQFTGPIGLRIDSWTGGGIEIQSENVGPAVLIEHYGASDGDAVSFVTNHGDGLQVVGTTADINADITGNLSGSAGSVASYGTLVADIWSYTTRTLTSLSALLASIWSYATRTLTQSAAAVTATVSGSAITVYRGDTWSIPLTGLGAITGYTDVWLTVKDSPTQTDAEALVQVSQTVGLERLNGAAATAAQGTLVVDDATAGNITVTVAAAASANVAEGANRCYDVQWKTATGEIHTLTAETFTVSGDITRAVS